MIKKITSESQFPCALLRQSWRGRKMFSYYKAYGLHYPFCQFYIVGNSGVMLNFNSTVLILQAEPEEVENLAVFLKMHEPFRIECNEPVRNMLAERLPEYQSLHRTTFALQPDMNHPDFHEEDVEFNPSLDKVYEILHAGFPNLEDYSLWLTDTSHRCRHGISHILTYKNSTTASILFDIDNYVLVGQVATLPEARGLGHARLFLRWLAGWLAQFNKQSVLYALDIRESFYREIGFTAIETEYVLERSENSSDIFTKGLLDNGNA